MSQKADVNGSGCCEQEMRTERPEKARVLTSYYRAKPGGLCKRLTRAVRALLRDGHEVHFLAAEDFPIQHERFFPHRFPWRRERIGTVQFWVAFHLFAPFILAYLGVRHRVTHAFSFSVNYAFLLQPFCRVFGVPLTLFLRADSMRNLELKGRSPVFRAIEHVIEGGALHKVHLYCVSDALARAVSRRHRLARPTLVGTFRNDLPAVETHDRVAQTDSVLRIGCVGLLEPRKNQEFLIRLLPDLADAKVHLAIFGTGPDEKSLQELAGKLLVSSSIDFCGYVEPERIWPKIDLLLMPSHHEGSPNAVLEALAVDIPVIASDIPEHREILPPSQLLPLERRARWIEMLQWMSGNRNSLRKMASEQGEYARRLRFDWDAEFVARVLRRKMTLPGKSESGAVSGCGVGGARKHGCWGRR